MIQRINNNRVCRRGFTLIELMIVIVVISIVSATVLFAMTGAAENAKEVRTRATITKLHDLIMQRYESYITRRVPLPRATVTSRTNAAKTRLDALRDLMRMEMPDRFSDFNTAPITSIAVPSITKHYKTRYTATTPKPQFESAECLYMIVAYGLQDQEALERFNESEVDDVDQDGLPEFIDGWGRPISFIRWAPAFNSPVQKPDPMNHHDPFDPMKQDAAAFAVYPLIYSGGPDKVYDVDETTRSGNDTITPFVKVGTPTPVWNGGLIDSNSDGDNTHDNITNHELLVQ